MSQTIFLLLNCARVGALMSNNSTVTTASHYVAIHTCTGQQGYIFSLQLQCWVILTPFWYGLGLYFDPQSWGNRFFLSREKEFTKVLKLQAKCFIDLKFGVDMGAFFFSDASVQVWVLYCSFSQVQRSSHDRTAYLRIIICQSPQGYGIWQLRCTFMCRCV